MSKSSTTEELFKSYQAETLARCKKGFLAKKTVTGTYSHVRNVRRVYWLKRRDMSKYSRCGLSTPPFK